MFSLARRVLPATAAVVLGAALMSGGLAMPAAASAPRHDPVIEILTGGDRTSSANGSTSVTGGSVGGVSGVTYHVTGPGGFSGFCTSADGSCSVTGPSTGSYTITQVSAPTGLTPVWDNYFINPELGVGTLGAITLTPYDTITQTITSTGTTTIPMSGTTSASTSNTVRTGRWAVSRYNPPPPTTCTRSVALLFDLSASITPADLAAYKTSATGFVRALLGTSTNVTLYTFGTSAPAPGTPNETFGPRNTIDTAGVNALVARIDGLTLPSGQFTNWDAGIWQIANSATRYNEAIVLTDGDPTVFSANGTPDNTGTVRTRFRNIEGGIFSANALKAKGTRVIAVGIANNADPGSIANLKAISGPEKGSDYFIIPFDNLEGLLTDLALADCASLSVIKSAEPTTYDRVGQTITYTYEIKNTSPSDGFRLNHVSIADDRIPGPFTCMPVPIGGELAPGQSTRCTATHMITQADMDACSITNTARVSGDTPNHDTVTSGPSTEDVTADCNPAIEVTKAASPLIYDLGTAITYRYTVRNTGNVTLHDVTVVDSKLGTITCTPATLAPGQSGTCHTATRTATQADVDAGSIANTVTATGRPDVGPPVKDHADAKVFAARRPAISVTKSPSTPAFSGAGVTITYTYTVKNTGNMTLHDVTVTDTKLGTISCPATTLAPGASMTCTRDYVTTVADADAGVIRNTVTAEGRPEVGPPVEDEDSAEVIGTGKPGIAVTKSASPDTFTAVGQVITYSYTVTNIGAVTLTDVTVTDSRLGTIACTPATLAPGASGTCPVATHTVTQADLDAGSIFNTVTATGKPPAGPNVSDEAEETVAGEQIPAIKITKTAGPHEYTRPGQVIHYTYVVTNIGNVTLTDITVTDDRISGPVRCMAIMLLPGASTTCHAAHTITQADLDAGSILNTATATGHPPAGGPVTDEATEEVTAGQAPELEITKTASPLVYTMHGQLITYTYTVSNTGNVTVHDISLTDTRYGTIPCPRTTLAPGQTMTCTFIHAITATDLDEGSIFNSAVAAGREPNGRPVVSEPEHATVLAKVPSLPEVPVTG